MSNQLLPYSKTTGRPGAALFACAKRLRRQDDISYKMTTKSFRASEQGGTWPPGGSKKIKRSRKDVNPKLHMLMMLNRGYIKFRVCTKTWNDLIKLTRQELHNFAIERMDPLYAYYHSKRRDGNGEIRLLDFTSFCELDRYEFILMFSYSSPWDDVVSGDHTMINIKTIYNVLDYFSACGKQSTTCLICLEDIEEDEISPRCYICRQNIGHVSCILEWLNVKLSCPHCSMKLIKQTNTSQLISYHLRDAFGRKIKMGYLRRIVNTRLRILIMFNNGLIKLKIYMGLHNLENTKRIVSHSPSAGHSEIDFLTTSRSLRFGELERDAALGKYNMNSVDYINVGDFTQLYFYSIIRAVTQGSGSAVERHDVVELSQYFDSGEKLKEIDDVFIYFSASRMRNTPCIICLEEMVDDVSPKCNTCNQNIGHVSCLFEWLKVKLTCPHCSTELTKIN